MGLHVCGYELPTNLPNFAQKDLTKMTIENRKNVARARLLFIGGLFLPRDTARPMPSCGVCLSVRRVRILCRNK